MVDQIRVKGGVLLGALVSGALAAATLGGAPSANLKPGKLRTQTR
jgi:hypothetical protein